VPAIDRQQLGRDAEQRASDFLQAAGLQIVTRNYRCRMGELDIVAQSGGTLIIAEVRCRSRNDYGGAAASVTARKQQRIVRASRHLLARQPALARLPVRFDVLVVPPNDGAVEWLRAAFDAT
jgi:putative endonuclease